MGDSSVKNEIKSESIEEEYNCLHCQKSFSDIHELDYHEKINHAMIKEEPDLVLDEEPISNEKPRFSYELLKVMVENVKKLAHSRNENLVELKKDKESFLCSKCPKRYYTKISLHQHKLHCHKPLNYKCHLCEKAFFNTYRLKTHIQEHQNLRKFKCNHCDGAYNTKWALILHQRQQGVLPKKDKQFNCDVCKDKFSTGAEVIVHCIEKHAMDASDVKPYKCKFCAVTCCSSSKLWYHKRTVHKK